MERSLRIGKFRILWVLGLLLFLTNGCDTLDEDGLLTDDDLALDELTAHTFPESPAVIDLLEGLNPSTGTVSVNIVEQPGTGQIQFLDEGNVRYDPDPQISDGEDFFVYEISSQNMSPVKNRVRIIISNDVSRFPCTLIALPDRVETQRNVSIQIDALANDRICGDIQLDSDRARIIFRPSRGRVFFDEGVLIYTPDRGALGWDGFAYRICSSGQYPVCSRAFVVIRVRK